MAWRTYITNGLERILLARAEHGQHICVHVNLHLLIALQLITQSYIRFTWIQLAPAPCATQASVSGALEGGLCLERVLLAHGSTISAAVSMSTVIFSNSSHNLMSVSHGYNSPLHMCHTSFGL